MLRISTKLSLPDDTVTSTLVVYGGKGMGKSHFGRLLAEELFGNGDRFCFLDPVGANWGLRFGKTKSQAGLEVLILGGAHGDIPIEPTAGAVVADLVADESISTVVDISRHPNGKMWSKGEKIRFVTDFCTRLYERQGERRNPLMLIIDEAGRYCPQAPSRGDLEITKCIGAIEELVELGRNVAVGVTLITQRSARMNKSVSELADCMVSFRTVGPRSVDAVTDWLDDNVPKERWKGLISDLRTLPRGSALVVSPGWLKFEGVVEMRTARTFDSSETPKRGKQKAEPGKGKKPNLDKYLERMRETVEKAQAHDPRALKARIAELEKQLKKNQILPPTAAKSQIVNVPLFDRKGFALIENAFGAEINGIADLVDKLAQRIASAEKKVVTPMHAYAQKCATAEALGERGVPRTNGAQKRTETILPPPVSKTIPSPPPPPNGSRDLRPVERKMLAALTKYGERSLSQVALLIGSPFNSTVKNAASHLRTQDMVDGSNDKMTITEAGRRSAGHVDPLPDDGAELLDHWCSKLRPVEGAMLRAWVDVYPKTLSLESVATQIDSPFNSTVKNAASRLRTLGLIEGKNENAKANERLVG